MSREERIKQANEMADAINASLREVKNSENGRVELICLDSLSVIAGVAVSGVCRSLDLELPEAAPWIMAFALPSLINANAIPRPNRLSNIADYETIKYLMGALTPYADKIYHSFSLVL